MIGSNRIRLLRSHSEQAAVQSQAMAAKAVGYIRVSTEEQAANGHGLDVQRRAILSFAQSQGYELIDIISDPGLSGAKPPSERPGFRRVLEMAEQQSFSSCWSGSSIGLPEVCCLALRQ